VPVTTAMFVNSIPVSSSPSRVVTCIGCRTLTSFLDGAGWYAVVACELSTGRFSVDGSPRLRRDRDSVDERETRLWDAGAFVFGRCNAPEEKSHWQSV